MVLPFAVSQGERYKCTALTTKYSREKVALASATLHSSKGQYQKYSPSLFLRASVNPPLEAFHYYFLITKWVCEQILVQAVMLNSCADRVSIILCNKKRSHKTVTPLSMCELNLSSPSRMTVHRCKKHRELHLYDSDTSSLGYCQRQ